MATRKKATPASENRSIDDYLAGLDPVPRAALEKLRRAIAAAAPEAEEAISYGLPALRYRKRPLVAYGAAKAHCAFYPMSPALIEAHRDELTGFETAKGTIRSTPDRPIPAALVTTLVRERMAELDAAASRR